MSGIAKRKQTIVRSHWAKLIENFNTSPLDFYQKVEAALERRQVPGLESGLVEWSEGGVLSANRTYLRLVRERVVIDICAAPFGTGFFCSWRLGEVPLKIRWWFIALVLFILNIVWGVLIQITDSLFWGTTLLILLVLLSVCLIKHIIHQNLADVDAAILRIPGAGELYERYLRKLTYYRVDNMMMYEQAVHAAVTEVLDEVTSAQGIALLSDKDRKPIMRDVYVK